MKYNLMCDKLASKALQSSSSSPNPDPFFPDNTERRMWVWCLVTGQCQGRMVGGQAGTGQLGAGGTPRTGGWR